MEIVPNLLIDLEMFQMEMYAKIMAPVIYKSLEIIKLVSNTEIMYVKVCK